MTNNFQDDQPKRLVLQIPCASAQERVQSRIKEGYRILGTRIASDTGLSKSKDRVRKWHDYNKQLLRNMFNTNELYDEYISEITWNSGTEFRYGFNAETNIFRHNLNEQIRRLESIYQRLELLPEASSVSDSSLEPGEQKPMMSREVGRRVFVVHGHDEEAKQSVARTIERLGLQVIILQEQPDQGRTIIEKFEDYADVDFSVVLLTPDDVGAAKRDQDSLRARARQNVILELGFFIGKLGRKHVCALYKGNVELPSDFSGILWTLMDDSGAWQFKLAREMKQAGLDVDMNKLA